MKSSLKAVFLPRAAVLAVIFAAACAGAFAKDSALYFLAGGQPDATALLAPPPLPDSPEQAADMEEVRAI